MCRLACSKPDPSRVRPAGAGFEDVENGGASRPLWREGSSARRGRLTNWKFVFSPETSDMMGNLLMEVCLCGWCLSVRRVQGWEEINRSVVFCWCTHEKEKVRRGRKNPPCVGCQCPLARQKSGPATNPSIAVTEQTCINPLPSMTSICARASPASILRQQGKGLLWPYATFATLSELVWANSFGLLGNIWACQVCAMVLDEPLSREPHSAASLRCFVCRTQAHPFESTCSCQMRRAGLSKAALECPGWPWMSNSNRPRTAPDGFTPSGAHLPGRSSASINCRAPALPFPPTSWRLSSPIGLDNRIVSFRSAFTALFRWDEKRTVGRVVKVHNPFSLPICSGL